MIKSLTFARDSPVDVFTGEKLYDHHHVQNLHAGSMDLRSPKKSNEIKWDGVYAEHGAAAAGLRKVKIVDPHGRGKRRRPGQSRVLRIASSG